MNKQKHEVVFRPKHLPPRNSQNRSLCILHHEPNVIVKTCSLNFKTLNLHKYLHPRKSTKYTNIFNIYAQYDESKLNKDSKDRDGTYAG